MPDEHTANVDSAHENGWVEWQLDALSPEDQQHREVMARFGLAVYFGQCVERQLAQMLASMFTVGYLTLTPDERDAVFHKEADRTLGQMVRLLRRRTRDLPASLEGRLTRAVNLRNWLTHDYFWDRAVVHSHSSDRREDMIAELQQAADFLSDVDDELGAAHSAWLEMHGVTEERVAQAAREMFSNYEQHLRRPLGLL